jgi:threonine dehydrogenase-like Zn-dependent dehydrogenase
MKAVVYHGIGDIRLDTVPDPRIQQPADAIIRITTSAICGTDLHMIRGTMPGMKPGTVLGHEAVGVVEDLGPAVRGFRKGDRDIVTSTIGCGSCSYCRAGYYAQCDVANPSGPQSGTCFFGGPESTGPIDGLQAEYARIPYAMSTLVRVPDSLTDDDVILLSDIYPTSWFGARLAEVSPGDTVAVFGAGIVGQMAILAAKRQGAGRVLVVDDVPSRLEMARAQNAEPIDFNAEHPVVAIRELTNGAGADRVIDAVGVDAQRPTSGPASEEAAEHAQEFDAERDAAAPDSRPRGNQWVPGDAPSQVSRWACDAVAKAGTIGIIGVYPAGFSSFPLGEAMNKNLTVNMGNCNHRRYLPQLLDQVVSGVVNPTAFITQKEQVNDVIGAYESFDRRESGWVKTVLMVG